MRAFYLAYGELAERLSQPVTDLENPGIAQKPKDIVLSQPVTSLPANDPSTESGHVHQIITETASYYDVPPQEYVGFRSLAAGREIAALLCRR